MGEHVFLFFKDVDAHKPLLLPAMEMGEEHTLTVEEPDKHSSSQGVVATLLTAVNHVGRR